MAARSRDEGGNNANKVVVHVTGIPERGCTRRHYSGDQLIGLLEGRFLNM